MEPKGKLMQTVTCNNIRHFSDNSFMIKSKIQYTDMDTLRLLFYRIYINVRESPKVQSRMDNPEKLAKLNTHDTVQRQIKKTNTENKKDKQHGPHKKKKDKQ